MSARAMGDHLLLAARHAAHRLRAALGEAGKVRQHGRELSPGLVDRGAEARVWPVRGPGTPILIVVSVTPSYPAQGQAPRARHEVIE